MLLEINCKTWTFIPLNKVGFTEGELKYMRQAKNCFITVHGRGTGETYKNILFDILKVVSLAIFEEKKYLDM